MHVMFAGVLLQARSRRVTDYIHTYVRAFVSGCWLTNTLQCTHTLTTYITHSIDHSICGWSHARLVGGFSRTKEPLLNSMSVSVLPMPVPIALSEGCCIRFQEVCV